jgi:hydroxymethylbilane synthase
MTPLRIGSRGSKLALWQANFIRDEIARLHGVTAEIVIIKTSGDRFQQDSVGQIGLKGVFIKEIEDALLARQVDLAVHSMKDVPTEIPAGLAFPAIYRRADARDCLVARDAMKFADLPAGARIGSSSLRRQAQLRLLRPDLAVLELRGNVDTRLRKLDEGQFDAIVLAKAGLDRLGWSEKISDIFNAESMLPAVGQGALGMECRSEDSRVMKLLARLDHAETRAAVTAERALLAKLEGGCQVPLGAWGRFESGQLHLAAIVLAADGSEHLRDSASGSDENAEALGIALAEKLLAAGAGRLLQLAGRQNAPSAAEGVKHGR